MKNEIARRIRNMVVAMPYGLETMLGLLDIVECETIPTAAVPIGGRPCLLINPTFVKERCNTDEKLFMLIMHELHHVLLGHTRLFQRVTPQHNLAFDAVINAMLCRSMPEERWTALFRDQYKADQFPYCLLRPPQGFPNEPIFSDNIPTDIKGIIINLYYGNQGTFLEVFEAIGRRLIKIPIGIIAQLLGDHCEDKRGLNAGDNQELFSAIRRIVENWPQPPQPIKGRSLNDYLDDVYIDVKRIPKPNIIVRKAILQAAQRSGPNRGRFVSTSSRLLQQFWPTRDRRAFAQQQNGLLLPIYQSELVERIHSRQKVHLYIDVSGSMNLYRQDIVRGVLSCQKEIDAEVYLFSTKVVPITLEELKKGRLRSTNGTDCECVLQHIEEEKAEAIVVLTDGYVGKPSQRYQKKMQHDNIQVVLTPNGYKQDLQTITTQFHYFYGE